MSKDHDVIDLIAFANQLPESEKRLKHAILQFRDANSIRQDLLTANQCLTSLRELFSHQVTSATEVHHNICCFSLLSTSIVLYVSALKSESDNRGQLNIRQKMNTEQQVEHDMLCEIRDNGIAHYGPGKQNTKRPWRVDGLFINLKGGNFKAVRRSFLTDPELADVVERRVNCAIEIVSKMIINSEVFLKDALRTKFPADSDAAAGFAPYLTRLSDFVGDPNLAGVLVKESGVGSRWRLHRIDPREKVSS